MNAATSEMSELNPSPKVSARIWIFAAIGAVAIHAACIALALANLRSDESDDDMGAPAIEIGLDLLSPRSEPTDLPPGPDAEASAASPPVVEQKEVREQTELPKAVPTETIDPDRLIAPPLRARKSFRRHRARSHRSREAARAPGACAWRGKNNWLPTSTSTSAIRPTARAAARRSW